MVIVMKRHAPFIAITIAAFVLLFACIVRGSEPVWFDAAADAMPDAANEISVKSLSGNTNATNRQPEGPGPSMEPGLRNVDTERATGCANGLCRVAVKSNSDKSNSVVDFDDRPRPFRSRRGLFRRFGR